MSFDLTAHLRLIDHATRPLRTMTSALSGAALKVGALGGAMLGITGAAAAANGAVKLLNATIGEAAKSEFNQVTITALFRGDEGKAKQYFDFINRKAAESVFSDTDFLGSSKSFIIMTKNMDELKKVTDIAERLAILDPTQGLEGAAIALRELNSGDITSLAERFEMPRKTLNAIKNLKLKDQLTALDKELNKYGVTQKLIAKQGETALGQYRKSIDKVKMAFRDTGYGALEHIKPKLAELNKFLDSPRFKSWVDAGGKALSNFIGGVTKGIDKVVNYIDTHYLSNPEFQKLTTFGAQVEFIFNDLMDSFNNWYNTGGSKQISDIAESVVDFMAGALKASEPLIDAATKMGVAIGEGILDGIMSVKTLKVLAGVENPEEKYYDVLAPLKPAKGGQGVSSGFVNSPIADVATKAIFGNQPNFDKSVTSPINPIVNGNQISDHVQPKQKPNGSTSDTYSKMLGATKFSDSGVPKFEGSGHSGGLSRVPYNGYPAILHRDEAVLHRAEARNWREGGGNGGVTITGNTFNVRKDSDINEIATQLYALIKRSYDLGAR